MEQIVNIISSILQTTPPWLTLIILILLLISEGLPYIKSIQANGNIQVLANISKAILKKAGIVLPEGRQ